MHAASRRQILEAPSVSPDAEICERQTCRSRAHDLANALASLQLRLRGLLNDPGCPIDQADNLKAMERILSHACQLNDSSNSPPRPLPSRPVDLSRVLSRAMELSLSSRAGGPRPARTTAFRLPQRPLPPVCGSEHELTRVFTNLFANARQAMGGGGYVHVSARRRHDKLVLEVSDGGAGVPAAIRQHIFSRGFSTKGRDGHGLGLAIARDIVESIGGSIRLRQATGRGACFEVTVPLLRRSPLGRLARPQAAGTIAPA